MQEKSTVLGVRPVAQDEGGMELAGGTLTYGRMFLYMSSFASRRDIVSKRQDWQRTRKHRARAPYGGDDDAFSAAAALCC